MQNETPAKPGLPQLACAITIGCLMSLALYGYQAGKSNHTVYLLDALRRLDPGLFARDWFVTSTLQYHSLFAMLARWTLERGIFDQAFIAGYALTVIGLHVACWRVVRALGGSPAAYLLAVLLYHLSAGGTGLGGFQFLQDGAFLPSNLANVAMLFGIAMLMESKVWPAAIWMGLAGLFHINHAVFAGPTYLVGCLALPDARKRWVSISSGALLCAALTLANAWPTFQYLRAHDGGERLSLQEYVQLFCRLRHPHHYYPLAWPVAAIVGPLWTLPFGAAALAWGRRYLPAPALRVTVAVGGFLLLATLVAWTFAGVFFVSERLIQMSLFRFSIYYVFLSCAPCAWALLDSRLISREIGTAMSWATGPLVVLGWMLASVGVAGKTAGDFAAQHAPPILLTAGLALAASVVATLRNRPLPGPAWAAGTVALLAVGAASASLGWTGLNYLPEDDAGYVALARWARDNTPRDAVFLVPPSEQCWRLEARRAIVVNFKAVPQTAAEMPEWKRRMQAVTGVQDLPRLAGTFTGTLAKLSQVYDARAADELAAVARAYGARYLVSRTDYPAFRRAGPDSGPWHVYDLDSAGPSR